MFHKGARLSSLTETIGKDAEQKLNNMLDQFIEIVSAEVNKREIRQAMVRSILPCHIFIVFDEKYVWIGAQKEIGFPSTRARVLLTALFSMESFLEGLKYDIGFDDPFIIQFPRELLYQSNEERAAILTAIAQSHVEAEFQRVQRQMNIIQINPIFGAAEYSIDPRLAFVLMPFTDDLTEIYQAFVKPTVETFDLVCRRADDIKSNKAIMQDIWKSICEARIIIADLSRFNPNVMYELGIAHTLGKETILIYQEAETETKFPFDLSHIRQIRYRNDITGGKRLEQELKETLNSVLSPKAISQ